LGSIPRTRWCAEADKAARLHCRTTDVGHENEASAPAEEAEPEVAVEEEVSEEKASDKTEAVAEAETESKDEDAEEPEKARSEA